MQQKWKKARVSPNNRLRGLIDAMEKVVKGLEPVMEKLKVDAELVERGIQAAKTREPHA